MKIVREHINEKFTEDSDPIRDMNIGLNDIIKSWIKHHCDLGHIVEHDFANNVYTDTPLSLEKIIINDDLSIDIIGRCDFSMEPKPYPDYISLNHVYGDFSCCFSIEDYQKYMPKRVGGEIRFYIDKLDVVQDQIKNEIRNNIKAVCKVKKIILKEVHNEF